MEKAEDFQELFVDLISSDITWDKGFRTESDVDYIMRRIGEVIEKDKDLIYMDIEMIFMGIGFMVYGDGDFYFNESRDEIEQFVGRIKDAGKNSL